jgi:hypothetical protein
VEVFPFRNSGGIAYSIGGGNWMVKELRIITLV